MTVEGGSTVLGFSIGGWARSEDRCTRRRGPQTFRVAGSFELTAA